MDEKDSASDERAETNSSVTPEPVALKPFSSHPFGASSRFISTRASATLQPKAPSQVTFSADVLDGDRPASHDRKRNRRALQDDSAIDEIMGQSTLKILFFDGHLKLTIYPSVAGFSHHETDIFNNRRSCAIATRKHLRILGSFRLHRI